jgi:hypothetical protein
MTHVIGQYLHVTPVAQKVERASSKTVVSELEDFFPVLERYQARIAQLEAERSAQVEAAFCEGYYMCKDGAWDSYSRAWPNSDAFAALQNNKTE